MLQIGAMKPAARDSAPSPIEAGDGVNQAPRGASKGKDGPAAAETVDDRELVERVQGGDEAAFRTLFERYHRRA